MTDKLFDFRLNQKTVVAVRLALESLMRISEYGEDVTEMTINLTTRRMRTLLRACLQRFFRAVVWIDDPIFVFNKVRGTLVFLVSLSGTLRKTETVRTQYLDASWL